MYVIDSSVPRILTYRESGWSQLTLHLHKSVLLGVRDTVYSGLSSSELCPLNVVQISAEISEVMRLEFPR